MLGSTKVVNNIGGFCDVSVWLMPFLNSDTAYQWKEVIGYNPEGSPFYPLLIQ
jgi:hypothetical protein